FLGLRLTRGIDLKNVAARFGAIADLMAPAVAELEREGLVEREGTTIRLTERGRLLSNEVFQRFLLPPGTPSAPRFSFTNFSP
ncbi:MAG: hypothetical protein JOY79_01785, partial [Acidobacteriaceae bacterium]|nr:hypothetical protein [Acidobacteriaceae bacterium]